MKYLKCSWMKTEDPRVSASPAVFRVGCIVKFPAKRLAWIAGLVLVPILAHADVITIDTKTQTFNNADCAKTNSCDLKDFVVKQEDYEAKYPNDHIDAFGTRMWALYDTSSVGALENYGIAQFIQGCQYGSKLVDGKVVNSRDISIEHYGSVVPFYFPNEVIDGFVPDPLDWGDDPNASSRQFFYLNKYVGSQEPQQNDYYGFQKPTTPRLYLRDMPGVAMLHDDGSATNLSLQFRLCLYKAADVPKNVPDTDLNFAAPLQCFGWNSAFVYNFDTKKFDQPSDLVDFCK